MPTHYRTKATMMESATIESPGTDDDNWPTLLSNPASSNEGSIASDEAGEWEMIPSNDEFNTEMDAEQPNDLVRQHSVSSPDLRQIEILRLEQKEEDGNTVSCRVDEDESMVIVSDSVSVASSTFTKISFRDAIMTPTKAPSFRDAILTPVSDKQQQRSDEESRRQQQKPPSSVPRQKPRPRIVVTPVKRCARSTPNLRALVEEEDDEEICGATDATEYYNQKAHGYHGRQNGLKQRPDEMKRQQMIMYKKNLQRQQQQQGGRRKKR